MKSEFSRKGFVWFIFPHDCPSLKEVLQGRNLKAGADTEAIEEGVLLPDLLIQLSYKTQNHQLRDDTTHNK